MELAHSWCLQIEREARGQRKLNVTEVLDRGDMNILPDAIKSKGDIQDGKRARSLDDTLLLILA